MDDQNPYESPGDTGRQRQNAFAFPLGGTQLFWVVLAVLAAVVVLCDALVVEKLKWESRTKREREQNAAPIVSESK